jgi:hypothetical protein
LVCAPHHISRSQIANCPGHYDAKVWDDATKTYISKPDVGVFITVEETFDNNHRVVAQRGAGAGKFTFSAADSGEHRLCVVPQNVQQGGAWFGSSVHASVKFTLDLAIGETSKIESTDKSKLDDLSQKVRDLNSRLQDVRREQVFQRVRRLDTQSEGGGTNGHGRSAKPNSVTSPSTRTPALSGGHSSSSSSSASPARGSCRICAHSSSSRSSRNKHLSRGADGAGQCRERLGKHSSGSSGPLGALVGCTVDRRSFFGSGLATAIELKHVLMSGG